MSASDSEDSNHRGEGVVPHPHVLLRVLRKLRLHKRTHTRIESTTTPGINIHMCTDDYRRVLSRGSEVGHGAGHTRRLVPLAA